MKPPNCPDKIMVSELSDDPDMIEIVKLFVEEMSERIAAFQNALAQQDFEALAGIAHQLKGSAGGYGFPAITEKAAVLERQAKDRTSLDELGHHVQELVDMCSSARATPD